MSSAKIKRILGFAAPPTGRITRAQAERKGMTTDDAIKHILDKVK